MTTFSARFEDLATSIDDDSARSFCFWASPLIGLLVGLLMAMWGIGWALDYIGADYRTVANNYRAVASILFWGGFLTAGVGAGCILAAATLTRAAVTAWMQIIALMIGTALLVAGGAAVVVELLNVPLNYAILAQASR